MLFAASGSFAQIPVATPPPPPPPGQESGTSPSGGRIRVDVNLVVLHTTVNDDRGKFVEGLSQDNFRVYEDKVEQKLSIFKREDIPVSMGLVIDNSGSMRDKRPRVNEAALTLVQNSNPQDEAFVVNFNDDFYLDLDKDFSSSIPELKEALERIDSRGSTALYDAIIGSLDHLKKGVKEKKVLLIVTDGEDNTSRNSLEKTLREIQKTSTVIYTIGLLGQENKRSAKNAKKALAEIAQASGGLAFFPENVDDVHAICEQVAHDRERGRRARDLRAGGARYPAPVHAGVLSVEWSEGRDVPDGACGRDSSAGKREIGGADEEWLLRAYGQ